MLNYKKIENYIKYFNSISLNELNINYFALCDRVNILRYDAKYHNRKLTKEEKDNIKDCEFLIMFINELKLKK